ncbi:MAG: PIN domain-containing protein [Deltaproteobacteria bacterium]|nr:PIN domain-containing protein [Deltaproteobacteria bacterium]
MALKPVRIFLDSNIILSGLLSDRGAPRVLLDLFSLDLPFLKGLTGSYNIMEIERNLKKKLPAVIPVYYEYLPKLNLEIIPLPTKEEINKYAGATAAKDIPVLVSAFNGKAGFLVTGDKKDFSPLKRNGSLPFKIVNPAEFLFLIPDFIERS